MSPALAPGPPPGPAAGVLEAYHAAVRARIEAAKRYPAWARRQGMEGRVTVAFWLTTAGEVAQVTVREPSGSAVLDDAAVEAVRRGAPYPPAPVAARQELAVTLVFALR